MKLRIPKITSCSNRAAKETDMAVENTLRPNNPSFKVLDLSAEVKKIWGPKWSSAEPAYEFSNGRKFELRTGDAAIYASSPDF